MSMMTWAELLHKVVMVQQTTRLCVARCVRERGMHVAQVACLHVNFLAREGLRVCTYVYMQCLNVSGTCACVVHACRCIQACKLSNTCSCCACARSWQHSGHGALSHARIVSFSLSLSHTHTHTRAHTCTHTRAQNHTHTPAGTWTSTPW